MSVIFGANTVKNIAKICHDETLRNLSQNETMIQQDFVVRMTVQTVNFADRFVDCVQKFGHMLMFLDSEKIKT